MNDVHPSSTFYVPDCARNAPKIELPTDKATKKFLFRSPVFHATCRSQAALDSILTDRAAYMLYRQWNHDSA